MAKQKQLSRAEAKQNAIWDDPAEVIIEAIAFADDRMGAAKLAEGLMPYCHAKLKQVEHSVDPDNAPIFNIITYTKE